MTGQVCTSLTRIIVSDKRHDDFVDALSAAFGKIQVGDPFDAASQMGPLAMVFETAPKAAQYDSEVAALHHHWCWNGQDA